MIARGDDSIPAAAAGAGLSHASLPPQADRHRAGRLGADPYEIAQRYALGHIPRDEMIAALAAWPYEQDFIPSNYWDDLGISPAGAFGPTVGRALDDGLLTDTDYDAILDAIAHYGRWMA